MKALKKLGVIIMSLALTVSLMPLSGMAVLADEADNETPAATTEAETEKPTEKEKPTEPKKTEPETKKEPAKEEPEQPKETEAAETTEAPAVTEETKEQEGSKATEAPAETEKSDAGQPKETEADKAPAETETGEAGQPKETEADKAPAEADKGDAEEPKAKDPDETIKQGAKSEFAYAEILGNNLTWSAVENAESYTVFVTDYEHPIDVDDLEDEEYYGYVDFDEDDEREISLDRLINRSIKEGAIRKSKKNKYKVYLVAYLEYDNPLEEVEFTYNFKTNATKIKVGKITPTFSGGMMKWKAVKGAVHYDIELNDGGMGHDFYKDYVTGTAYYLDSKIDELIQDHKIFKHRFYRVVITAIDDDGTEIATGMKDYTYDSPATPYGFVRTISCSFSGDNLNLTWASWAKGYKLRVIADNQDYMFDWLAKNATQPYNLREIVKQLVEYYELTESCNYNFELYAYDSGDNYVAMTKYSSWHYKDANTLSVSGKTAKVKYKKAKKKNQNLSIFKVVSFANGGIGTRSYSKVSGNKKITINKSTGKVTVKKKIKKGTYKVTIWVKSSGDNTHIRTQKKVTFKIKVK